MAEQTPVVAPKVEEVNVGEIKADVTTPEVEAGVTTPEVKANTQAGGALAFSELKGGKKSRRNQRSQKRHQKHGGSKKRNQRKSKRHQRGGK